MESAAKLTASPSIVFRDALGERRVVASANGRDAFEILCIRGELSSAPAFEFALRERVSRVGPLRHGSFAPVRGVERLKDHAATLALVSDRVAGDRLSDVLAAAERRNLTIEFPTALQLVRQLVPAVAWLHEQGRELSHGTLGPERIVVTPQARVVVVEQALGSALEQLRLSHDQYWKDLRIPLPRSAGLPRFDQRADVLQIGAVTLALLLGRPLTAGETPSKFGDLFASVSAVNGRGAVEPLPLPFRAWLSRALQLDTRDGFDTAVDALDALDRIIRETDYFATTTELPEFLERYRTAEAAGSAPMPPLGDRPAAPLVEAKPPAPSPASLTPAVAVPPAVMPAVTRPVASAVPVTADAHPVPLGAAISDRPRAGIGPGIPPTATAPVITAAEPPATVVHGDKTGTERSPVIRPLEASPNDDLTFPRLVEPAGVSRTPVSSMFDEPDEDIPSERALGSRSWFKYASVAVGAVAMIGVASLRYITGGAPTPTGTVVVNTDPTGASLAVDGSPRGATPQTLTLPAGEHNLELRSAGRSRSIAVMVTAGAQVTQYLELPKVASTAGQLQVRTEPSGAGVTVDGVARGTSPVTVSDLAPGAHVVEISSDLGTAKHEVTVESGAMASVLIPLSPAEGAPVSGWVAVTAPVDLQLYENGRLIGSSQTDRVMVPAGSHHLELVNEAIGYRDTKTVQVGPGKVATVGVKLPDGSAALNAVPWAEVWIDGKKAGETPIGNLSIPVGQHEFVFRHPELGEQRQVATVTLTAPLRLSVDMRRK